MVQKKCYIYLTYITYTYILLDGSYRGGKKKGDREDRDAIFLNAVLTFREF